MEPRPLQCGHPPETDAAVDACQTLADALVLPDAGTVVRSLFEHDNELAVTALERGFDGIVQAGAFERSGDQTVDNRLDIMPQSLSERLHVVGKLHQMPVDAGTDKTVAADLFDDVAQLAFFSGDVRSQDHHLLSGGNGKEFFADRLRRLRRKLFSALRAVGKAGVCVKQTQIVVNFRYGCNG